MTNLSQTSQKQIQDSKERMDKVTNDAILKVEEQRRQAMALLEAMRGGK